MAEPKYACVRVCAHGLTSTGAPEIMGFTVRMGCVLKRPLLVCSNLYLGGGPVVSHAALPG